MTTREIVARLVERFGPDAVRACSPFHVQVRPAPNVLHNLWVTADGLIKWQLDGNRFVRYGALGGFLDDVGTIPAGSDLIEMRDVIRSAREITQSVDGATRILRSLAIDRAIFCDAGFRDGRARISVVGVFGETIEAFAEMVRATGNNHAESRAVALALSRYPPGSTWGDVPIFTDSQHAVHHSGSERVRWISRAHNREADWMANLRGKS